MWKGKKLERKLNWWVSQPNGWNTFWMQIYLIYWLVFLGRFYCKFFRFPAEFTRKVMNIFLDFLKFHELIFVNKSNSILRQIFAPYFTKLHSTVKLHHQLHSTYRKKFNCKWKTFSIQFYLSILVEKWMEITKIDKIKEKLFHIRHTAMIWK